MLKRRQAIIWTIADPIHWRIYVALGDELNGNLLHGTVHHPLNYRSIFEILELLERYYCPSDLLIERTKISKFRGTCKNGPNKTILLMPRSHIMLPPYGCHTVLVVVTNVTATARRPYDSWDKKSYGDRKETGRWPYGNLTVVAATTSLPYGRRKGAVRPTQGLREATVQFSRHPRQGKNRMPPHGHHEATVQFGVLRSPHSRRKHAASYMWPWQ